MKWYAYCITCNKDIACMKPSSTASLHGSVVEKFAEHHQKTHLQHKILIGYLYRFPEPETELTFNIKGVAHHG